MTQFFALAGLRALATLAGAAAAALAAQAAALDGAIMAQMFNASLGLFCDGICADPAVAGHTSAISSAWALFLGAAPPAARAAAWSRIARDGLEGFGDYGAFVFLSALAAVPEGDGGAAMLTALAKCDAESWCAEMRDFNATMTRESWVDPTATYSHAWGTSPLVGVSAGIMGVAQTAPAWAAFTVRPRLGGLARASITLPTLRGPISVEANASATALRAPCGSEALLCAPLPAGGRAAQALLDGEDVSGRVLVAGGHACVARVGCGAAGAARVLALR